MRNTPLRPSVPILESSRSAWPERLPDQTPTAPDAPETRRVQMTIHLQNIPLFSGLPPSVLSRVAHALILRPFEKGTQVIRKGSSGEHLVFLISGALKVVDVTEEGQEVGLSFLAPGDYTGELSIIDGLPRSATVFATKPSLLALLPRADAQELIYTNPLVARRVLEKTAAKVREASSQRLVLGIGNSFQRFYTLINRMAKPTPGGLVTIENLPTQQEIAAMINTSRETVSRALRVLLDKGIVERDLRRLIVRKPETLAQMAASREPGIRHQKKLFAPSEPNS